MPVRGFDKVVWIFMQGSGGLTLSRKPSPRSCLLITASRHLGIRIGHPATLVVGFPAGLLRDSILMLLRRLRDVR